MLSLHPLLLPLVLIPSPAEQHVFTQASPAGASRGLGLGLGLGDTNPVPPRIPEPALRTRPPAASGAWGRGCAQQTLLHFSQRLSAKENQTSPAPLSRRATKSPGFTHRGTGAGRGFKAESIPPSSYPCLSGFAAGVAAAPGDSGGRSHARDEGSLSRHNRGHLGLGAGGKPQGPRRIPEEGGGLLGRSREVLPGLCTRPGAIINQKLCKEG